MLQPLASIGKESFRSGGEAEGGTSERFFAKESLIKGGISLSCLLLCKPPVITHLYNHTDMYIQVIIVHTEIRE